MGMGVRAYARHRKVSHCAVSKAIEVGRITLLEDGSIDPETADKQWAGSLSRANAPKKTQKKSKKDALDIKVSDEDVSPESIAELVIPDGLMLTEIKAIHETVKAKLSYLGLAKDCGILSDALQVDKQLFTLGRTMRDGWFNWVNQVAGEIASELRVEQHTFTILLENSVTARLIEMADRKYISIDTGTSNVSAMQAINQIRAAGNSYDLQVPVGASLNDIKAIHETVKARRALRELIELRESLTDVSKINEQLIVVYEKTQVGWLEWIEKAATTLAQDLKLDHSLVRGALENRVKDYLTESKAQDYQVRV